MGKQTASRVNETTATPTPPNNILTVNNVNKLNVAQLKAELKRHGDKISGNKSVLRTRLKKAMRKPIASTTPAATPIREEEEDSNSEGALLTEFIEEQLFYQGYAFLARGEEEINSSDDSYGDSGDGDTQNNATAYSNSEQRDSYESAPQLARHVTTPESYKQAMRLPQRCKWQQAMDRELASLREMDVFKVVPRPANHPVIATRWTYRVKSNANGSIEKYKARFVAKGFLQTYMVNYKETYAPVARATTVRMLLTMRLHFGWPPVHQMDVDTAFLYATLQELVYCEPPEGYEEDESKCWLLNRALYGLKQAPKEWFNNIKDHLLTLGLEQSTTDPCLFLQREGGQLIGFVAVYVDDLLVGGRSEEQIQWLKNAMHEKYKMKDMGILHWYLGMNVVQGKDTVSINQRTYIETVLERFDMQDCSGCSTPMLLDPPTKDNCPKTEEEKQAMSKVPYRSAIGALMYLAVCTRPDIAPTVHKLAKHVVNPGPAHWKATKRVMRYLQHTINFGLTLSGKGTPTLKIYVDASHGDKDQDGRSTTGMLCFLGPALISWTSVTQPCVARSTTEAEYIAASDAAREAIFLHRQAQELGMPQSSVIILEDNQGCIKIANNDDGIKKRTKHIDVRYHHIKQLVRSGFIQIKYCQTVNMLADIMTKPLNKTRFAKLRALLGIVRV